jgi:hypothetical protein
MHSSEAFRLKIASDFAAAMKPTTGGKIAHIQWFLPMHMMADFFAVEKNVRRTTTMYIFDTASPKLLQSLMDDGWNEKYVVGQDVTKCVVSEDTIVFRYHVGRQVLYANFQYVRFRAGLNQTWVPLDQVTVSLMVAVCVRFGNMVLPSFEVGEKWPVAHIRNEIGIILSKDVIPEEYDLIVERTRFPNFKVSHYIGVSRSSIGQWRIISLCFECFFVCANPTCCTSRSMQGMRKSQRYDKCYHLVGISGWFQLVKAPQVILEAF